MLISFLLEIRDKGHFPLVLSLLRKKIISDIDLLLVSLINKVFKEFAG